MAIGYPRTCTKKTREQEEERQDQILQRLAIPEMILSVRNSLFVMATPARSLWLVLSFCLIFAKPLPFLTDSRDGRWKRRSVRRRVPGCLRKTIGGALGDEMLH